MTTDTSVTVFARLEDATIHIGAQTQSTTVRVTAAGHDRAEALAAAVRAKAPLAPSGTVSVRVWHHTCDGRARYNDRDLDAPRWLEIEHNYPVGTRAALRAVFDAQRPVGAGKLLLWHRPPGTGKTTAVRALLGGWAPWCQGQYIADPEKFFGEPAYMIEVLTTAAVTRAGPTLTRAGQPESVWRLLIAEDTDEYLRSTARRDAGAALGRLLNLADGILGQGMTVLLLLTTNEETTRLHPALIRPGRCLAAVEFPPFAPGEAWNWLDAPVDREMTLAELLAKRGDLTEVAPRRGQPLGTGQYL